ncbi:predicted protein [Botrytis cinerea T4]|uniref:Uncharacterized protein n=1 Tax=Botryotinia fuckeliana (strain T4) TaxID=999810 RepID=G2YV38_BOTF4|nr:predicted protein [Botrytis cinerea T4]
MQLGPALKLIHFAMMKIKIRTYFIPWVVRYTSTHKPAFIGNRPMNED